MFEENYQRIIVKFLSRKLSVDDFINDFIKQWKLDRDGGELIVQDEKFQRMINRIFTSCDCYASEPSGPFEISETELRSEIELLSHVWWNLSSLDGSVKLLG